MTVYAPDLRGFGDSSYVHGFDTLEDLADDIKLFMLALGIAQADLVGWSTGGGIALEFAAKYPQMTGRVVLIESTSHKGYPIFKKEERVGLWWEAYKSKSEMAADPVQVAPALQSFKLP